MKALLASDIHASYRLLSAVYENFKNDQEMNCLIFVGDVVDMGEPVSFVDEFLWTISQLGWELLWVPGNNDFGRAYHRLNAKVKSVEGRIAEFDGRSFAGVGGSPASWSGQYQGERAVDKKAIAGTIFLSHVPPPGINSFAKYDNTIPKKQDTTYKQITNDKYQTSNESKLEIRNLTLSKTLSLADAPLVHICGHVHHTWGIGYLGTTKVVKMAGAYLGYVAVMDLETLHVEFQNLFR